METLGLDLASLHLESGSHASRAKGVCIMEAVAWFRGIEHSDAPPCVSPVLRGMGMNLNDNFSDDVRQKLIPLIPVLVDTAGDGMDDRRGLMAADWLIRTYTPTWLRLAKLNDEAAALEALPEIVDTATLQASLDALNRARKSAAAARAAAGDAAWDAAWAAAWDAAGAAAGAAAWAAAGAAAWAAARAAARDAAGAAAWAAAGAAAGDAAWDAAGAAAGAAAWAAARDAAGAAAWDALKPTVAALQESAIDLYRRMAELHPVEARPS